MELLGIQVEIGWCRRRLTVWGGCRTIVRSGCVLGCFNETIDNRNGKKLINFAPKGINIKSIILGRLFENLSYFMECDKPRHVGSLLLVQILRT